ncbi:phosphate acetyltransferase [Desulfohalovibrio reitneri]|uniref:phosphate acetyltransferase n=1 Tax=Desulfohalovibrio reitneri TaxID=1307759 RepID=UPI0004A6A976|nr:phosphate acetyltransferase [Desulfohalovibrio reitneri]
MSRSLYITATESRSGKSAIVLGVMQEILRKVGRPAIFRPVITAGAAEEEGRDHDIELIRKAFNLDQEYEQAYAMHLREARELINTGRRDVLLETVLGKFKELEQEYDFVLCEGTDFLGKDPAFEFELNAEMAANLGAPVLFVANGRGKTAEEVMSLAQGTIETLEEAGVDILAAIVNRLACDDCQALAKSLQCKVRCKEPLLAYAIPEVETLGNPTMKDVAKWLKGQVIYGHGQMETLIEEYLIAAMQIGNFLEYIDQGALIITPGDRSDIILASLASRLSSQYPDISGMVLTGGLQPPPAVHKLIEGWTGVPVPIVSVKEHTHLTTQKLNELYGRIGADDPKKIATALGVFESNVDVGELSDRILAERSSRVTPKMFEYGLVQRAAADPQRIVLPEGTSERVLRATDILLRRKVADIILVGGEEEVHSKASQFGLDISGARIVDPSTFERQEEYAETYFQARQHKGVRLEDAADRMLDPTYFGTMMVHLGDADGMVSGSVTTTAQTIRPAFEFVKTKPGFSIVSSAFFMCLRDRVLVFGDCAVNPNPNAQQLAEIAINSAQTAEIFGIEPRVAMLSYSTGESGSGTDVQKVVEATAIAKERAPDLLLEGPLQYDAAIDPETAKTKAPNSKVAGQATVFIFPDLNTGNNTYKAVQRAAGAVAIGPVLQGLNKPVNDLSRGCVVEDIVNTVAITAVQAQAEKQSK